MIVDKTTKILQTILINSRACTIFKRYAISESVYNWLAFYLDADDYGIIEDSTELQLKTLKDIYDKYFTPDNVSYIDELLKYQGYDRFLKLWLRDNTGFTDSHFLDGYKNLALNFLVQDVFPRFIKTVGYQQIQNMNLPILDV